MRSSAGTSSAIAITFAPVSSFALERGNILGHRHHLRAGEFFHKGIALHVIPVRMTSEQNLNVRELEPELLYRSANRRYIALVVTVDQDVPFGCRDQKRSEALCADVVKVSRDFVRRKRRVLHLTRADVALEKLLQRPLFRRLAPRHTCNQNYENAMAHIAPQHNTASLRRIRFSP
jgi:hypothetical protein